GFNTNGCETALNTTSNCGGCGNVCSNGHPGTTSCNGTTCSYSCAAGFGDCVTIAPNLSGCETTVSNNRANCNACGTACTATQLCGAGGCVVAPAPGILTK